MLGRWKGIRDVILQLKDANTHDEGESVKLNGDVKEVDGESRSVENIGLEIEENSGESSSQNEEDSNDHENSSYSHGSNNDDNPRSNRDPDSNDNAGSDDNEDNDEDDGEDDEDSDNNSSRSEEGSETSNSNLINTTQIPSRRIGFVKHLLQLADEIADKSNTIIIRAPSIKDINLLSIPLQSQTPKHFYFFNRLPAEVRLKIRKLNLPGPYILDVKYRQDMISGIRSSRSGYMPSHRVGIWVIENPLQPFTNLYICQESRFEALKTWFNFKTDTYFLDTSASTDPNPCDVSEDIEWIEDGPGLSTSPLVFGPRDPPFSLSVLRNLRFLAISVQLWDIWPFACEYGSDVTCDLCPGHSDDQGQGKFQRAVFTQLTAPIAKVSLVLSWDVQPGETKGLRFVEANEDSQEKFKGCARQLRKKLKKYTHNRVGALEDMVEVVEIEEEDVGQESYEQGYNEGYARGFQEGYA